MKGEGHFAALFEKRGEDEACKARPFPVRRDRAAEKAWREFAADFFVSPPEGTVTALPDGRLFLLPEGLPALPGRVLRAGVELGEYNGKRFTPAHALAMSAKREEVRRFVALEEVRRFVALEREEAERYLHGEALAGERLGGAGMPQDGWCMAGYKGYPLGLGKLAGGQLKNHLPKALRAAKLS